MKIEIMTKNQIRKVVREELNKELEGLFRQIEALRRRLFRIEEDLKLKI